MNRWATRHACERLRDRVGVEIPAASWQEIVKHAKSGTYGRMYIDRDPPGGAVHTYAVPMGTSWDDRIIVPMVVNVDDGRVVTVLDPVR